VVFHGHSWRTETAARGAILPESRCSRTHEQPQVPPAGLGSGMAPGLVSRVVGRQLRGYPAA
jgi:hypothetical protein